MIDDPGYCRRIISVTASPTILKVPLAMPPAMAPPTGLPSSNPWAMDGADGAAARMAAAKAANVKFVNFITSSLCVLECIIYHGFSDFESALTATSYF
jgi:hypothetical protein